MSFVLTCCCCWVSASFVGGHEVVCKGRVGSKVFRKVRRNKIIFAKKNSLPKKIEIEN